MNAVEFDTVIQNGKIDIPSQYLQDLSSRVRVILIQEESGQSKQEKSQTLNTKDAPFRIYGETVEEIAFKQSLNSKKQLEDFDKLNKAFDKIEDEPLDEEFLSVVNAEMKFKEIKL
jgi:hypothetical protein